MGSQRWRWPKQSLEGCVEQLVADEGLLAKIVSDQREAAVRAHEAGDATEQGMERCLLRTAMMSAAVTQALASGRRS